MSKSFEYLGSVLKLGGKIGCIIIPGVISRATSEDTVTLHSQTWHLLLINIYPVRDIITVQTECPAILPRTLLLISALACMESDTLRLLKRPLWFPQTVQIYSNMPPRAQQSLHDSF